MEEKITIPLSEYKYLLGQDALADALTGAGVDNWAGWESAMELRKDYLEEVEELIKNKLENENE